MEFACNKAYLLQHFQELRIIQPTLLFLHGLPLSLSSPQVLEKSLSLMGPIISIKTKFLSNNFFSAFLEFQHEASAALLIMMLEGAWVQNRSLRVFYGCTKFCPHFLKSHQCKLANCKYAHYYYPQLTHSKDQAKSIDHKAIASFIISSQTYSQESLIQALLQYSPTSPLLSFGSHHLPMVLQSIGYNYDQKLPYEDSMMKGKAAEEEKVQASIEKDKDEREEDWTALEKEIVSESGQDEDGKEEDRSARIQEFLDGAERLLTKLIFQSSVFVY